MKRSQADDLGIPSQGNQRLIWPACLAFIYKNKVASVPSCPPAGSMGHPEIEAGALGKLDAWRSAEAAGPCKSKGVYTMTKFIRNFVRDETGAAAAEYALILAVVGGLIGTAAFALGGAISDAIEDTTTCLEDTTTC